MYAGGTHCHPGLKEVNRGRGLGLRAQYKSSHEAGLEKWFMTVVQRAGKKAEDSRNRWGGSARQEGQSAVAIHSGQRQKGSEAWVPLYLCHLPPTSLTHSLFHHLPCHLFSLVISAPHWEKCSRLLESYRSGIISNKSATELSVPTRLSSSPHPKLNWTDGQTQGRWTIKIWNSYSNIIQ